MKVRRDRDAGGMIAGAPRAACAWGDRSRRSRCARPRTAEPDSDPRSLLARAFANLYADDYIQTLELAAESPGMRPVVRTLQILRKQSVQPGKALVRFLEPFDVRRTSVLILENADANDDLWVYLPALRMTRRISSSQRADSFFGTDLSYEDVEPKHADDYDVTPGGARRGRRGLRGARYPRACRASSRPTSACSRASSPSAR